LGDRHRFLDRYFPKFRYSSGLCDWLRLHGRDYDCVVVSGIWSSHTLAVWRALRDGGTPYVLFAHGMLASWFRAAFPLKHLKKQIYWWLFLGRAFREARYILFTCERERQDATRPFIGFSGYRELVVRFGAAPPRGADPTAISAFRTSHPALDQRDYLLFLGRIHPKKALDLLIEGLGRAFGKAPPFDLVIAGPDPDGLGDSLKRLAERAGVLGHVHFVGMLEGDMKGGAVGGSLAVCLTSHQENFGMAAVEGLACGKPALLSRAVDIWEEIVSDGAGLAEADTLLGIEALLRRFAGLSPAQRGDMQDCAVHCYRSRFSEEIFADDMRRIAAEIAL
jgi:glycosyltransferase involved in cell wall biosynthesis